MTGNRSVLSISIILNIERAKIFDSDVKLFSSAGNNDWYPFNHLKIIAKGFSNFYTWEFLSECEKRCELWNVFLKASKQPASSTPKSDVYNKKWLL
jgi:hypothetical protein